MSNLTVTNISALEAEKIRELPPNTVLISINPSNGELFRLNLDRQSSKVLTVRFDDVLDDKIDKEGYAFKKRMDGDTGLKILDFININKHKNFIIHCAAGISRSGAIAFYIHLNLGHKLKDNFYHTSRPNPYVLGVLTFIRNWPLPNYA